jgi:hypothetical protein
MIIDFLPARRYACRNYQGSNHMAVLANIRHENFAQQLARGVHPRLAAKKAGFLDGQRGMALKSDPTIVARVNELLEDAASVAVMDASEILQGLTIMARGDLRDVLDPDAVKRDLFGNPVIDPMTGQPVRDIHLLHPTRLDERSGGSGHGA